jgi:NADH-quinone oxidoreductase subunit N
MPDITHIVMAAALTPEILVATSAFVLLLGGVLAGSKSTDRLLHGLGMFVLLAVLMLMLVSPVQGQHIFFSNLFVSDGFSSYVKMLLVSATALVFMISEGWLVRSPDNGFEFTVLMLFSLLGAMLMVSANDMLSLYVGLELSSLPLYVLASFSRDSVKSTEAGLKYFVLGALASGLLLYGISLVYGFTGTTNFTALAHLLNAPHGASGGLTIGLVLIIVGLCFKVAGAPFHMWSPDVYEGAPTPITAFLSTASKIAAIALLTRVLIQPFGGMMHDWRQIIVAISILSMLVGAFGALTQTNIKRLLAYSSIGHAGYGLMGLAAGSLDGVSSVLIYFALYVPMSVGAFACVLMMNRDGKAVETMSDLAGLSRSRPGMAFALSVFMFSMAGIPPLAGFFSKLYVFLAALHAGLTVLAVIGVLASVVACFYYLKIVKLMYFDEPAQPFDALHTPTVRWALVVCALITALFFIVPTPLVVAARSAAQALFL